MIVGALYTYQDPKLTPQALMDATGMPVTASQGPQHIQQIDFEKPVEEKELEGLDRYMLDLGYVRTAIVPFNG